VKIEQFEHVLRAAAGLTGETIFVVVGSQAVLAQHPHLPAAMSRSVELDIYPKFRPDLADVIDGAIGADSPFHGTFGYHADGVGPETARLPRSWEERAIEFSEPTTHATALCPEIHDLAVSKLLAGREKDFDWMFAATEAKLVYLERVADLLADTDATAEELALAKERLERIGREARS
jgi:hypothetical protein